MKTYVLILKLFEIFAPSHAQSKQKASFARQNDSEFCQTACKSMTRVAKKIEILTHLEQIQYNIQNGRNSLYINTKYDIFGIGRYSR